ncbi:MAG: small multi-drug export protein [Thermoplasmata archaeon]|nr:MAG: small multi-drug export protein [Thermoplasmata archaeon]
MAGEAPPPYGTPREDGEPEGIDEETQPAASPLDRSPGTKHTWAESLDGIEVGDTTAMKLFKVLIPFAIPAAIFAFLFFVMDYTKFLQLGAMALSYLFPPLGKESIIPIGIGYGFTKWQMTGLIFMVDVVCAMFISWNLPLAKKIPGIGRIITWVEKKGSETLEKNPGLRTVSWIGLVLWVMVPFQGSGGITASIIGRAIGMRASHVISAVGVGALIAGFLIGTVAEEGMEIIRENWVAGVVMIAVVVVVALVLFLFYKRYTDQKNQEARDRDDSA